MLMNIHFHHNIRTFSNCNITYLKICINCEQTALLVINTPFDFQCFGCRNYIPVWRFLPRADLEEEARPLLQSIQEGGKTRLRVPVCSGVHLGREGHHHLVRQRLLGHVLSSHCQASGEVCNSWHCNLELVSSTGLLVGLWSGVTTGLLSHLTHLGSRTKLHVFLILCKEEDFHYGFLF